LCEHGASVAVADVDAAKVEHTARAFAVRTIAPDDVFAAECDVFAPCALGGVLDVDTAAALRAQAVCGAANNPLVDAAAGRLLHERGVVFVPDFVANAGGLIHGASFHLEGRVPPPERYERIGDVVAEILAAAARERSAPEEVALRRARERLAAAPAKSVLPA
jgi:leucine dehydrogenase